ncbi:OsmC family protein [uncultured Thermanaerothrix sp.]
MIIDESPSLGGTDGGPSPVQVLLMSLAGCLKVTGQVIAEQRR